MTAPSSKLIWVIGLSVSGLLFLCTIAGAGLLWYVWDAVYRRSQVDTISEDTVVMLDTVAQALYWYVLPVILASALLAIVNLYLVFAARRKLLTCE
jgi:hypothetical protein